MTPEDRIKRTLDEVVISPAGTTVHLQGYGLVRVFRIDAPDGVTEYWATGDLTMDAGMRRHYAEVSFAIENYHRELKQNCGVERCQARSERQRNHIGLALRAFLRLEWHFFTTGVSGFEAKARIVSRGDPTLPRRPVRQAPRTLNCVTPNGIFDPILSQTLRARSSAPGGRPRGSGVGGERRRGPELGTLVRQRPVPWTSIIAFQRIGSDDLTAPGAPGVQPQRVEEPQGAIPSPRCPQGRKVTAHPRPGRARRRRTPRPAPIRRVDLLHHGLDLFGAAEALRGQEPVDGRDVKPESVDLPLQIVDFIGIDAVLIGHGGVSSPS